MRPVLSSPDLFFPVIPATASKVMATRLSVLRSRGPAFFFLLPTADPPLRKSDSRGISDIPAERGMTVLAQCPYSDVTVRKRTEIQPIAQAESSAIADGAPIVPPIQIKE